MPVFSLLAALAISLASAAFASARESPDQQADRILESARRAFNDRDYPAAVDSFREFTRKFGKHKDSLAAHYGLALSLLEGPDKDYQAALKELSVLGDNRNFSEYPFVQYYRGFADRGLGLRDLARAASRPNEAPVFRHVAQPHFDEAAKHFAQAVEAFSQRAANRKPVGELPLDLEWACRARCDQAEMLQRLGKLKDCRDAVAPLLNDPALQKSRYRRLGLYYHSFACFLQKDYTAANVALRQLAPFTDPVFGVHARYLVARLHHIAHERRQAREHYQGVLADHGKLQAPAKAAPPDHVARAQFFLGVLHYEDGQFGDALGHFQAFARDFPSATLAAEAILRQGFCQVKLKMWGDAQKTLQDLAEKEPRLADQCWLWVGKAQVGAAANDKQALQTAVETFRKAGKGSKGIKINKQFVADPLVRMRRGESLLAMADTQQLAGQYRDAATTYEQILQERLLSDREEEVYHNLAVAWQRAGDYASAENACAQLLVRYPQSPLISAVLFRQAENAYLQLRATEQAAKVVEDDRLVALRGKRGRRPIPEKPNKFKKPEESKRHLEEMEKRYRTVVEKYPGFPLINLARYGLAAALHRKGEYDKALECLQTIPESARVGELAAVEYLSLDCRVRRIPAGSHDAAAAARSQEQLKNVIEQLETFVTGMPGNPHVADALIDLGYCQQRLAALQAQPQERSRYWAAARTAYEQLLQRFPRSEQQPLAVLERGKVLAQAGDIEGAISDLNRFTQDPLQANSVAPSAVLSLTMLLRGHGKPRAAADALFHCRMQHENKLSLNPATSHLVAALQYHHGLALREAGQDEEARGVLETLARSFPDAPESQDTALFAAQCLKDEGMKKIAEGRKRLAITNLSTFEIEAAQQVVDAGYADLRTCVSNLAQAAEKLRQNAATSELRARLLYEAARTCRLLIEPEIESARGKIKQELIQKRLQEQAKLAQADGPRWPKKRKPAKNVAGKVREPGASHEPKLIGPTPEVALSMVPVQKAEQETRGFYKTLIASFPSHAVNLEARFELAALLSERGEHEAAIKLLQKALTQDSPIELADNIRLRLGAIFLSKGDAQEALQVLKSVADNPASPLHAQAIYRIGECCLFQGMPAEAIKQFTVFRDQGPLQNLAGIADRALLRLGHVYAQQDEWDKCRETLETLAARFPASPWVPEARYTAGWAYQRQGQYDQAIHAYQQVADAVSTELSARAQLGIGVCRMSQKRFGDAGTALLLVPCTSEYPQLSALAMIEAARACSESQQVGQAVRLLERVIRDYPNSEYAEAAHKRLAELQ